MNGPNRPRLKLQHGSGSYREVLLDLAGFDRRSATELRCRVQDKFAQYLDTPNLVQTPMCRTGIYLAIKHLITPGQEVIMSPYTIADVVNMVICAVATPRAELAASMARELQAQALQSRGFVAGRLLQGALTDLVTSHALFSLVTRRVFRLGLTRNIRLINRFIETELDSSRVDTLPPHYLHGCRAPQLALLSQQIDGIEKRNAQRRHYAGIYLDALHNVPGLVLPRPSPGDVYSALPIQVDDRHGLLCHMLLRDCDVAAQHLKNCAELSSFSEFAAACPNARACAASVVLLPTYPGYGERQVQRNIAAIREFLGADPIS